MSPSTSCPSAPVEAILLGAGNRGADVYGAWALENPAELRFTAVADADPKRRAAFAAAHGLAREAVHAGWRDALEWVRPGTAVFVCLPDALHEAAAVAALERGAHLMLEKPIAPTLDACRRVADAAARAGTVVTVAHVLRHAPLFAALRRLVREEGRIGQVEQVTWRENVSSTHYAHSFVRGNWASEARSAPMILAKCCHDLDQIGWVTGQRVSALASFGRLTHFRPVHAPAGAPERCTDGCPAAETCPYFAPDIYLTADAGWPASVISLDHSLAARREALETGPYGRCVYRCDNDVVDTQVLAFEFEGGATGTLTMHGFSSEEGRTLRLDGTRGSLMARFATRQEIRFEPHDPFTSFHGGGEVVWTPEDEQDGRHGGGDGALCRAFVAAVRAGRPESVDDFLESHWLAFAAETSRQTGQVVPMDRFRRGLVAR